MTYAFIRTTILGASVAMLTACANSGTEGGANSAVSKPSGGSLTYFLTSTNPGGGANLGGLAGADAHCEALAASVGAGGKNWKAYLSTTGAGGVNARSRIGSGPWHNANGVLIASSVDELHSSSANLTKETSISESGAVINGRGDSPNRHDIITGSLSDGTASTASEDTTCSNWTSSSTSGSALAGHHDRIGGGADPTSWNSAHGSRGCTLDNLKQTGGDGLFYCFAAN